MTDSGPSPLQSSPCANNIVMEGAHIDCGRRIVDSLIERRFRILGYEQNVSKGHRLILGDMATVPLNTENTA